MAPLRHHRVILFGLSADPPTGNGGHAGIIKALLKVNELADEIRVLPVYRHPYSSKRDQMASFGHRMQMCRLAFQDLSSKVRVADDEYKSWLHATKDVPEEERSNLTIGTAHLLEYLKATEPKVDFRFCLGADAYHDLMAGKWIESERILQLVGGEQHLVIFQRAGHDDIHNTTRASSTISKQRYVQIPHLTNVSSSQVRACTDLETIQELVLPEVLAYILENKLYAIGRQQTANANES